MENEYRRYLQYEQSYNSRYPHQQNFFLENGFDLRIRIHQKQINRLSPWFHTVFVLCQERSHQRAFAYLIRNPSFLILSASFSSLGCKTPHPGQTHSETPRTTSLLTKPQLWQVFVDGNHSSIQIYFFILLFLVSLLR